MSASEDAFVLVQAHHAAQTKTKDLKTQLEAAEAVEVPVAGTIDDLKTRLTAAKIDENAVLVSLQTSLAALNIKPTSPKPAETAPRVAAPVQQTSRLTARISPPKEYKHTEDFRAWSKRFQRYLSVSDLRGCDALLLMLNCVDERTAQRLETVVDSMTPEDEADYARFMPLFEEAIYPKSESRALRLELAQLSQTADEDIGSFAARIRNIASRAYDGNASGKDDCCYQTFVRGILSRDIKLDVMKGEVESFEKAVQLATKLERIISTAETSTPEAATGLLDVMRVRETPRTSQPAHPVQNPTPDREQHFRSDNAGMPRQQSYRNQDNYRRNSQRYDNSYRSNPRPANNSRYDQENRTCYSCGTRGHLWRNCNRSQNPQQSRYEVNRPAFNLNMQGAGNTNINQTGRGNQC